MSLYILHAEIAWRRKRGSGGSQRPAMRRPGANAPSDVNGRKKAIDNLGRTTAAGVATRCVKVTHVLQTPQSGRVPQVQSEDFILGVGPARQWERRSRATGGAGHRCDEERGDERIIIEWRPPWRGTKDPCLGTLSSWLTQRVPRCRRRKRKSCGTSRAARFFHGFAPMVCLLKRLSTSVLVKGGFATSRY